MSPGRRTSARSSRSRVPRRHGVVMSAGVLALANLLNNRWLPRGYVATCVGTATAQLALARRHDLTWGELGLGKATARSGLRWAATAGAVTAATYVVAILTPGTRAIFADDRAGRGARGALYHALVRVPAGTVLLEEVGFRGVLWGLMNRRYGAVRATGVSSALFGLWHILPARELARGNTAAVGAIGRGSVSSARLEAWSVAGAAATGVVLCELRRRSGSLLAPAGLHWATNGLGVVGAALVRAEDAGHQNKDGR